MTASKFKTSWGGFGLIDATLHGIEMLLLEDSTLTHIVLMSETCLPIRSFRELREHLTDHPRTDFINCFDFADADWIGDGLAEERLTLFHPFSFRTQRRAFDLNVALQRLLRVQRKPPEGITPYIGDQWWCLTTETIRRVLCNPNFETMKRFFRTTWIPDESFFQTLVANWSDMPSQPALTCAEFDRSGKPYVFYDDHLDHLRSAPAFFARKIWPEADMLYDTFLSHAPKVRSEHRVSMRSKTSQIRRHASNMGQNTDHRRRGYRLTSTKFYVFVGFGTADTGFADHLRGSTDLVVYPQVFKRGAQFTGADLTPGNVLLSPRNLRYNPHALVANILNSHADGSVALCFEPGDQHGIWSTLLRTSSAHIVFLEDHWRARCTDGSNALRKRRVQAIYNRMIARDLIKNLRADFQTISWDAFQSDRHIAFETLGNSTDGSDRQRARLG
ncbi:MAG: beta-1,6-N-acetylglucosaminyltransferase [Pseudomonadota bacterium]